MELSSTWVNEFVLLILPSLILLQGTLQNGESRLLFSSAQVDFIRYWLHAMRLTSCVIPMPYSDCMLVNADLRNVSPVVYKSAKVLKKAPEVQNLVGFLLTDI
jgi:hypothetical protein